MANEELRTLLRRLVLPIYLPTALFATGAAAIVPVVPLVGLRLGKTLSADLTPPRGRARWLGLWNSFTGAGGLVGPALVAATTGVAGVVAATIATGWLTLFGAAWAAWWVPRLLPGRVRR